MNILVRGSRTHKDLVDKMINIKQDVVIASDGDTHPLNIKKVSSQQRVEELEPGDIMIQFLGTNTIKVRIVLPDGYLVFDSWTDKCQEWILTYQGGVLKYTDLRFGSEVLRTIRKLIKSIS